MPEEKITEKEAEKPKKPEWVKVKPADFEKIIIDLYKQGMDSAKIGLVLRDQHGVPKTKLFGKRIMRIIRDAKLEVRSEKEKLDKKIETLKKHIEKNIHDIPAKKKLIKELWALKKLV